MEKRLFTGLIALFTAASGFATTEIYVKPGGNDNYNGNSWNTAYQTVGKAIENVQANSETIIYLEGNAVFNVGVLNLGENKQVTIIGKNSTLRANEKPGKEGGEGGRILRAATGSNLTVKGINFENGRQIGYVLGGALFFSGETLVVDSCRFLNNEAGSSGGAIGARGKEVIIRNSYFEGNYTIGGGSIGAAVMQAGKKDVSGCSLTVENCTFYKNDMSYNRGAEGGGLGTAIGIYDKSGNDVGGEYTNLALLKVINCTFVENTSLYAYQAAIDISASDKVKAYLINNTFYKNDGALRIGDIYKEEGGEVVMINNLIYAEKAGILGNEGNTVADLREPIVGYNNIISGIEGGVNQYIDDECFGSKKAQYNNIVEMTGNYPLSRVALSTALSTDNFVPYLAMGSETSEAVNAGLDDSSPYTGNQNFVPSTDVRGKKNNGLRDIGAYEYEGVDVGLNSPKENGDDFFILTQNGYGVTVVNASDRELSLEVIDMTGRTVYSGTGANGLTVSKEELKAGIFVFVVSDGVNKTARKVVIY